MKTHAIIAALCLALAPAAALAGAGPPGHTHDVTAFGAPGDPRKPARVVTITMKEGDSRMEFAPNRLEIRKGEQVRFKLVNAGQLDHELVIGTLEGNMKHAEEMKKNPDMEHDDPNAKRLAPGATGEIVWRFTRAGSFDFSCLIPGHREAGMAGTLIVK
ncbi:cupredoxin family protein [Alsobacter sp. SYSU M60028]|uniref:Cupredoxin family protein n=1 Tax=Alsobacter ponti TaxID=2962936 RepID=A0ABT1LFW0_9HYPH|nr:cupredoxin family protein [Alsobacter ponti]MCP8940381.1 cupredoxin family protein [Alsobacter ponti]